MHAWNPRNGSKYWTSKGVIFKSQKVEFSPDSSVFATYGKHKTVGIFDTISGTLKYWYEYHSNNVTQVEFSPDGRKLVCSDSRGIFSVLDLASRKKDYSYKLSNHPRASFDEVRFEPSGKSFILKSRHGAKKIFLESGKSSSSYKYKPKRGRYRDLVKTSSRGSISLGYYLNDESLVTFNSEQNGIVSFIIDDVNGILMTLGNDGSVKFWNIATLL